MIHILCFGNPWHGDDGFGHEVHRRLAGQPLPDGVRLFDAGTRGLDALALLDGCRWAVLVDALRAGGGPGGLKLLEAGDVLEEDAPVGHAAGLGTLLRAARATAPVLPRIDVLGTVASAVVPFSDRLSAPVAAAAEDAAAFLGAQIGGMEAGQGWRGLVPVEDPAPVAWDGPPRWTGTVRLPGPPRATEILIVAHGGRLTALKARCRHQGEPLARAPLSEDGAHLICPRDRWHVPLTGWVVLERAGTLVLATEFLSTEFPAATSLGMEAGQRGADHG